jgi:hypothetical protein
MGKKLIINGADFSANAIDGTAVCELVNTQTYFYFKNTGEVAKHPTTPYSDIRIYRVTVGEEYILHGPTPTNNAYGIMAQLNSDSVGVGQMCTLISGPQINQSASYTYTFTAPTAYIGITDPGYELGTHSFVSLA